MKFMKMQFCAVLAASLSCLSCISTPCVRYLDALHYLHGTSTKFLVAYFGFHKRYELIGSLVESGKLPLLFC